jgi:hypothetical protein
MQQPQQHLLFLLECVFTSKSTCCRMKCMQDSSRLMSTTKFRMVSPTFRRRYPDLLLCCCYTLSDNVSRMMRGGMMSRCGNNNVSVTTTGTTARTDSSIAKFDASTSSRCDISFSLSLLVLLKKRQIQEQVLSSYRYFQTHTTSIIFRHNRSSFLLLTSSSSSSSSMIIRVPPPSTRWNNHIVTWRNCGHASLSTLFRHRKNILHQYNFAKVKSYSMNDVCWISTRHIQTSTQPPNNENYKERSTDNDDDNNVVHATQGMTADDEEKASPLSNHSSMNLIPSDPTPCAQPPMQHQQQQQQQQPFFVVVQHWLQQLRAIPNIITVSRILLIPFISYWIIQQQTMLAFVGCIYAAISDVVDGYIARRYPSMQTALGTYLDPLGTVLAVVCSLSMNVCIVSLCSETFGNDTLNNLTTS